jgi:hypothetical protein
LGCDRFLPVFIDGSYSLGFDDGGNWSHIVL